MRNFIHFNYLLSNGHNERVTIGTKDNAFFLTFGRESRVIWMIIIMILYLSIYIFLFFTMQLLPVRKNGCPIVPIVTPYLTKDPLQLWLLFEFLPTPNVSSNKCGQPLAIRTWFSHNRDSPCCETTTNTHVLYCDSSWLNSCAWTPLPNINISKK